MRDTKVAGLGADNGAHTRGSAGKESRAERFARVSVRGGRESGSTVRVELDVAEGAGSLVVEDKHVALTHRLRVQLELLDGGRHEEEVADGVDLSHNFFACKVVCAYVNVVLVSFKAHLRLLVPKVSRRR